MVWLTSATGTRHLVDIGNSNYSAEQQALIDGLAYAGRLYARFLAEVDRRLDRASLGKPTERRVLVELGLRPETTDAELVKSLGIEKAQMSRTLASLEKQGLIESRPTPRHSLQRLRHLTLAGRKNVARILERRGSEMLEQYDRMSPEERSILVEVSGLKFADIDRFAPGVSKFRPVVKADYSWIFKELATSGFVRDPVEMAEYVDGIAAFSLQDSELEMGFVAEQAGQRVGVCLAVLDKDYVRAEIAFCYVVMAARSKGIAGDMIQKCVKRAKLHTLISLTATTVEPSSMSKVLERNNFRIEPIEKRFELTPRTPRRFILNLGGASR